MPLFESFLESVASRGLATGQATANAPRSTFGQVVERKAGAAASKILNKPKKKGAITYSLTDGKLSGSGENFNGTFTSGDLDKFTDEQFDDVASQLGVEGADPLARRRAVLDAIKGSRSDTGFYGDYQARSAAAVETRKAEEEAALTKKNAERRQELLDKFAKENAERERRIAARAAAGN